jgi:hypothetical protein
MGIHAQLPVHQPVNFKRMNIRALFFKVIFLTMDHLHAISAIVNETS